MANWIVILGLSLLGVALCGRYAYTRANLGMCLFAAFFGWQAIAIVTGALVQTAYLSSFVQQQTGPNTWTAPVLNVDAGTPIGLAMLLVACLLVGNRLPVLERTSKTAKPLVAGDV
jgi:hypothetical protein